MNDPIDSPGSWGLQHETDPGIGNARGGPRAESQRVKDRGDDPIALAAQLDEMEEDLRAAHRKFANMWELLLPLAMPLRVIDPLVPESLVGAIDARIMFLTVELAEALEQQQ